MPAAGSAANDENGIHIQVVHITHQRSAKESAGLLLADENVLLTRGDLGRDLCTLAADKRGGFLMTEVLSALNARVKEVLAALTDRVDNGKILLAEHGKQLLDGLNGIPASSAAACAVLLHGFEDVFGFVADEAVVNVDHDQRRTLAVANALAVTGA